MLTSDQFGAKGDGASDDTQALQAALDAARGGGLRLEPRRFRTSGTLFIPSDTVLEGAGAVIAHAGADVPALASAAWAGLGPVQGRTRIRALRIEASGEGTGQHGLVLHDYWSEVAGVEVSGTGGRGIMLADTDRSGAAPTGTLVENRILNCIVREAKDTAFWLGAPTNGKLTDGMLTGCIAWLAEGVRAPALFIGHAAGWTVDGLHSYGGLPDAACHVEQAYFTSLSNLYLESFTGACIRLDGAQTGVALSNVHMVCAEAEAGSAYIAASAHADYERPHLQLGNVTFWHDCDRPADAVRIEGGVEVSASNASIAGPRADLVSPGALQGQGSGATGRRGIAWSGRQRQRIAIDRRRAGAFEAGFLVTIAGRASDGGLVTSFAATLAWSRIDARSEVALADIVPLRPAEGFLEPPVLELEREDGTVTLYLSFAAAASGPGHVTIV